MTARFKSKSIREEGLQPFLDRTVAKHNGMTYERFVWLVEAPVKPAAIRDAARMKDRHSAVEWVTIYKEEKARESDIIPS